MKKVDNIMGKPEPKYFLLQILISLLFGFVDPFRNLSGILPTFISGVMKILSPFIGIAGSANLSIYLLKKFQKKENISKVWIYSVSFIIFFILWGVIGNKIGCLFGSSMCR